MSALESACSRYVGLVTGVDALLAAPSDSRLTHHVATGARGEQRFEAGGAGYAADPAAARAAAIGEAIERYAAAQPHDLTEPRCAARLDGAVEPERFALFGDGQYAAPGFPFVPFTSRTPVRWAAGRSLADGRPVFLPAQLVHLVWDDLAEGEAPIAHATSSALACGASLAEAALAALLEAIERDAFMIVWRNRLTLPLVDASAVSAVVAWERRYLDPARLRRSVVDLSGFHGVATMLAVVEDAAGSIGVGAAAAAEPETAYRKALAEAYATHGAAQRMRVDRVGTQSTPGGVTTFADHIRVYSRPGSAARASFLTASDERVSIADRPRLRASRAVDRLDELVRGLGRTGLEAFAVDVSTPDVTELGLHVVKAVVPELCMLDVREDACFLGGPRLRRAPVDLGLRARELGVHELNLDPHPFP